MISARAETLHPPFHADLVEKRTVSCAGLLVKHSMAIGESTAYQSPIYAGTLAIGIWKVLNRRWYVPCLWDFSCST